MKITCQACQAKYTIADEKVVGKVVKIRCKKCGASIVVNANQSSLDPAQATAGEIFDAGLQGTSPPVWTVNVAEGDQRTMTEAEIVAAYGTRVVTDETFCWKEGMADWLPLQEIAPLVAACKALPSLISRHEEDDAPTRIQDPSMGPAGVGVAAASPAMASNRKVGNGLHGSARPPAAPVAARRATGRGAVADLFGGVAQAGGEDEVLTSAPPGVPQAHGEAQKVTGVRNESSVLFAVQEKGDAPAPPSMVGTNEASGLIDIRQLAAQMHASADDSSKKKSRVDDIMNLGGGGAFSPSLAAPILTAPSLEQYSQPPPSMVGVAGSEAPPPPKSKALAFLAVSAGLFFLIAAASVALMLLRGKGPLSADEGTTTASAREPMPMASTLGAPTQLPSVRATTEAPQASVAPETKTSAAAVASSAPKETPPTKEAKESAPAPPKEPKATTTSPKEAAPPTGAPAAEFNMGEARSRLAAIAGGVQSCKRGETSGSGKVEIVFAPSGTVQSATLIPGSPFDGSTTGKCVEARFRGARVPAFGGSPFTVTKSFSIN